MANSQALLLLLLGGGAVWLLVSQSRARVCPPQRPPTDKVAMTLLFYWYDGYSGAHMEPVVYHLPTSPVPSWRNAEWLAKELADMAYCGIDIVLPVWWGDENPSDEWSYKGLDVMAQAWAALADNGVRPPGIGMFFDTAIVGGRDLRTLVGKDWFAGNIMRFFGHIHPNQWALIDGRPVVSMFISNWATAVGDDLFEHVSRRFAQAYGVEPYIIREVSWSYAISRWQNGTAVRDFKRPLCSDGSYIWGAAPNGFTEWNGYGFGPPLTVASVGPGYDERLVPGRPGVVRDRRNGAALTEDIYKAGQSALRIMLVETWNEMHEGSGVCETLEHGRYYLDLARAGIAWWKSL